VTKAGSSARAGPIRDWFAPRSRGERSDRLAVLYRLEPKLTSDWATPSATRPGHDSGLRRASSGRERAQTAALSAAVEPYAPNSAARCRPE